MAQAFDDEASEITMLTFQDSSGNERPDCLMLDPGASAFLSGYQPFRRYLQHLQECGFPVEKICMTQGRRRFQFGGDAASWSSWSAHLPVFVDGRYGTIQLFLLPGNTPMLCGRPIIESLGVTMDFAMKRIRIGSSGWTEATIGRQGEYLLSLTSDHDFIHYDPERPEFTLRTAEPDMDQTDGFLLADFEHSEHGFVSLDQVNDEPSEGMRQLKRHELKTMDVQLTTHLQRCLPMSPANFINQNKQNSESYGKCIVERLALLKWPNHWA